MSELKRRISENGAEGKAFWAKVDAAVDRGVPLEQVLNGLGLEEKVIADILEVYPNIPSRSS